MSAEVIKVQEVRTRKEHKCFGCTHSIPKDTLTETHTIRNGNELYRIYLCSICSDLVNATLEDGDEYYEGQFTNEANYIREDIVRYE